jgi:hypothetical protein
LAERLAQESYIRAQEFRHLALQGFAKPIDTTIADRMLTETEEDRIDELLRAFGLNLIDLDPTGAGHRLAKASILRQLDEGKLPRSLPRIAGHNPINLERGEVVLWVFNGASYYTPRSRTQYVGGSQGVSIRIAKGVYYRTSTLQG